MNRNKPKFMFHLSDLEFHYLYGPAHIYMWLLERMVYLTVPFIDFYQRARRAIRNF